MLGIRQAPCMGSRRASTLPSSVYVGCCCFWNRCTSAKKRQRSSCSSRVAPKVYYTKVVVKYVFIHPGKPWKSQLLMNRILEAVIVCILCCHKLRVKNCRFMYNPRKLCTTGHWVHCYHCNVKLPWTTLLEINSTGEVTGREGKKSKQRNGERGKCGRSS